MTLRTTFGARPGRGGSGTAAGNGLASAGAGSDHLSVGRPVLDGPSDYLLAGLLVLVAVGTGGTWLVGQTAALITGHGWLPLSPTTGWTVMLHLPGHWSDPAAAWPTTVQSRLPGSIGMTVAAALDVLLATTVLAGVARRWGRGRRRRGFASPAQLRAVLSPRIVRSTVARVRPGLTSSRPQRGRLAPLRTAVVPAVVVRDVAVDVGRADSTVHGTAAPVVVGIENSVLVLAAPRQGKTSQVVIPWVTDWPGPAVVTSVRPDVVLATAALRAEQGRPVAVMDLTGTGWPHPLAWSPTAGCTSFDVARRRADLLITVGKSTAGGIGADSTNAAFFGTSATNLLAGWLHAAALTDRTMSDVLTWALDERNDEAIRLLRDHPRAATGTAAMLDALYRSPVETRSNLFATVLTGIAPLLSETARAVFCPPASHSFTVEEFLDTGGTIYLIVPDTHASELAALIASFVDDLIRAATARAATSPTGRLDPPLGLFLDEVANVAPLPQLPQLMSFAAGSGIFVTAVLQDLAQARARWGRDGADMLWAAATCKLVLGGLTGDEPGEISRLAGTYRETLTTTSRTPGGVTLSASLSDRPILTPDAVRTLNPDLRQALLLHATTPPVITRMVRHYEGPRGGDHARAEQQLRAALLRSPGAGVASSGVEGGGR